jgi:hypothetical protein
MFLWLFGIMFSDNIMLSDNIMFSLTWFIIILPDNNDNITSFDNIVL